ncbi:MAG: DUF4149 domain-containing protein [Proteobacteria bacterium]|nr:DUF4149 domain-containing protein [Pseudomonadota bacterium]MCZ6881072.1 DUF4149 domain-containing protein [Gammaproteobacteria bacterium]
MSPTGFGVARGVVLSLWAGSLWTVGYLAAPTLFAVLDDRRLAGEIAGRMFYAETWLSLICAALILLPEFIGNLRRAIFRLDNILVIVCVVLLVGAEWGVRPLMDASRLADGGTGPDFAMWHGVAAGMYLCASIVALVLLWRSNSGR